MDYIDRKMQATDDAEDVGENFHEFEYESSDPIKNLQIIFLVFMALLFLPLAYKFL